MGKISTITQKSQIKTELKRNQMKACMIYLSIYLSENILFSDCYVGCRMCDTAAATNKLPFLTHHKYTNSYIMASTVLLQGTAR